MKQAHPPNPLLLALSDIKIAHSVFALPFAILAAFLVAPRSLAPAAQREVDALRTAGTPVEETSAWVTYSVPDSNPTDNAFQMAAIPKHIDWPRFLGQLALVVLCMVLARTWAMLVNRLADHRFDAGNPRTARRVFASGRLDTRSGWLIALGCAALFQLAAAGFWIFFNNSWPTYLAIPVLGWIALYSFTKRFTWLCHLFLGGALAASPIAAVIAVNPSELADFKWVSDLPLRDLVGRLSMSFYDATPDWRIPSIYGSGATVSLLAAFVLCWVAGFDVAYALQDIDFDRTTGLHSIPAKLGHHGALWVSRALHTLAFLFLLLAWIAGPFALLMFIAVVLVAHLLVFEHIVLARRGVAGLPLAFFTLNGIVSLLLGAVGCIEVIRAG